MYERYMTEIYFSYSLNNLKSKTKKMLTFKLDPLGPIFKKCDFKTYKYLDTSVIKGA